jgi:multiple sugar transport system ATP-binding protein
MRTELNELHQRVGKTTIYVTHDQAEAMTLGDRVAVMNDGRLQQIGPPQQLYDNPINRFVAGFIGEPPMNFFDVEFDGSRVSNGVFDLELPAGMAEKARSSDASGQLTFGIRPEDLDDVTVHDIDPSADNVIEAYVKVLEPMGSDKFLTLTEPGGGESEFTARVDPESEAGQGETVRLAVDLGMTHLFDDEGRNITY